MTNTKGKKMTKQIDEKEKLLKWTSQVRENNRKNQKEIKYVMREIECAKMKGEIK